MLSSNRASLRESLRLSRLRVVVAVFSFIVYASAVVALQQYLTNFYYCERVGLAAGVSFAAYRAPLGTVELGIETRLLDTRTPAPPVLDKVAREGSTLEGPKPAINDGNGIGFIVAASWAMRLLGPHLFALPFFLLGLMAISAVAFLWRFRDDRSAVVTVTFFSLTLMLCTPLVSDPNIANQVPIGGIRYFSLLALLPAFHLGLELADAKGWPRGGGSNLFILAIQVILLALAILVRGSAASLLGPIFLMGLVKVWRSRGDRNELRSLYRKATVIIVVGTVFIGSLLVALPPSYIRDGRVGTLFWHRAIISLGLNPVWPFGNLKEIYDCKSGGIPDGIVSGLSDRNGHCIWWHYVATHNIPTEVGITEMYSGRYEAVMRAAFFNIVRLYPSEVLTTLFYYKPKSIVQSLEYLAHPVLYSPILRVLVIAGFVNFLGFLLIPASFSTESVMLRVTGLGALFGVSSIPSYLVAWATPSTAADLLFYSLLCMGLGLSAVVQPMRVAMMRASAERAKT